jgi:hypothetical protein
LDPRQRPSLGTRRFIDPYYEAAYLDAARVVVEAADEEGLNALVRGAEHFSIGAVEKVQSMLVAAGHDELSKKLWPDEVAALTTFIARSAEARRNLDGFWSNIASRVPHAEGCPSRRLATLGDLLTTMDYANWGMVDVDESVADEPARDALERIMRIIARVMGLPWDEIACDATILVTAACNLGDVADAGTDRSVSDWPSGEGGKALRDELLDLMAGPRLVAGLAQAVVVLDPDRAATLAAVDERLKDEARPRRRLMADAAMALAEDRETRAVAWFQNGDGPLRIVAAGAAARLSSREPSLVPVVTAAVVDQDAAVRVAVMLRLRVDTLTEEVRDALRTCLAQPPIRWTCSECGRVNRMTNERCESCREHQPQWDWRARDLLGDRQGIDVNELLADTW